MFAKSNAINKYPASVNGGTCSKPELGGVPVLLSVSIVVAALYVRATHGKEDAAAGPLAIYMVTTRVSIVVATAAALFELLLQNAVDMKPKMT